MGGSSSAVSTLNSVNIRQEAEGMENSLPKEDAIEVMGKVVEKFRAGMFTVELDAGVPVLASMAGRLRRNRIKIMTGDRVSLELSPYDLTKGRITYRHK
jgi:translation initiation factor IF-1